MTTEKSPAADADSSEQQQAKEEEGAGETQKQEASLEEGAQPTPEGEPQRQKASNGDTPTHEEQSKKERRTSEGRGLSRLFSSFLRRPKSQVSEEDKDSDAPKEAGGDQKDAGLEDILVKAPIAAPEPELKTDPSLDLHSLSSAETQVKHPSPWDMLAADLKCVCVARTKTTSYPRLVSLIRKSHGMPERLLSAPCVSLCTSRSCIPASNLQSTCSWELGSHSTA
uniref:Uncharacterized protein n=1 Tax=Cyanistes caeruleus TaxID=156563 RepID=A0A8C0UZ35_CYACU